MIEIESKEEPPGNGEIKKMSFVKGLIRGFGASTAVAIVVFAAPGFAQATKEPSQMMAQAKTEAPAPSPATERGPSNVDLVNKALKPGASDPDVPLPHPDLANSGGEPTAAGSRTQFFGRQEQGGGVLGLRMPIPADRNAAGKGY